jgi:hypothetical protein
MGICVCLSRFDGRPHRFAPHGGARNRAVWGRPLRVWRGRSRGAASYLCRTRHPGAGRDPVFVPLHWHGRATGGSPYRNKTVSPAQATNPGSPHPSAAIVNPVAGILRTPRAEPRRTQREQSRGRMTRSYPPASTMAISSGVSSYNSHTSRSIAASVAVPRHSDEG